MKDYGNAVALCGALGCMVLLIVSMHFSNKEEPAVKDVSAEVSQTGEAASGTKPAQTTEADSEAGTDGAGDTTDEAVTTTPSVFIGPLSREAMATSTTEQVKLDLPEEELHALYAENLSIVGDSIASGFGAYQVLMNPYNFAVTNLSVTTVNDYSFNYDGQTLSYIGALSAAQPGYIYLSMGMNDLYMADANTFAENYMGIVDTVLETCPDSIIIVAGITPVSDTCSYAPNSVIQEFNSALQSAVEAAAYDSVYYFDTASILGSSSTGGLMAEYDGGDGIHLSLAAYSKVLEEVCLILDEMPMPPRVYEEAAELAASAQGTITETETVTEAESGAETGETGMETEVMSAAE
ncbi:MAG: SGNH/GDSL hydrolase family protein [Ruminococcus sp.]|nr:SGNH/GDSL hydrolase family protein [Ruminococcus sp.]